jgi:hypothetical protein
MGRLQLLARATAPDPDLEAQVERAFVAARKIEQILVHMGNIRRLESTDRFPNNPPMLDLGKSGSAHDGAEPPSP